MPERRAGGHVLVVLGRADDGDALGHHDLVAAVRVQVAAAHEARLGRVGVDPAQHEQVLAVDVIEQPRLVDRLARVARARLLRDHQLGHEERVGDQRAAQHAARLQVGPRVGRRELEEGRPQVGWEEDGAQRRAGLEVRGGGEGEGGGVDGGVGGGGGGRRRGGRGRGGWWRRGAGGREYGRGRRGKRLRAVELGEGLLGGPRRRWRRRRREGLLGRHERRGRRAEELDEAARRRLRACRRRRVARVIRRRARRVDARVLIRRARPAARPRHGRIGSPPIDLRAHLLELPAQRVAVIVVLLIRGARRGWLERGLPVPPHARRAPLVLDRLGDAGAAGGAARGGAPPELAVRQAHRQVAVVARRERRRRVVGRRWGRRGRLGRGRGALLLLRARAALGRGRVVVVIVGGGVPPAGARGTEAARPLGGLQPVALEAAVDARLQRLERGQVAAHVGLGEGEGGAVLRGARLRVRAQVPEHELGVAEEEEVGLLLVALMFVDLGLGFPPRGGARVSRRLDDMRVWVRVAGQRGHVRPL